MKEFVLNKQNLRKAWNGGDQHWFSRKSNAIKDTSDLADIDIPDGMSQATYFVSLGYVPYFVVSEEEIIRAYVTSLDNEKLKTALSKIDKSEYVDTFWKYYNAYPKKIAMGWDKFENDYVINKAIKWCEENQIDYVIK